MALQASTVWEFRISASNNNGGGYISGGTDYSQQDAAELNPTDLAMAQGSTTLTSANGGFTSAMVGNLINITAGANFDTGRYEIATRVDTNTVTLDRTAASGGIGANGTGYIGGALALPVDAILETWIAGNTGHMKAGTYTLTGAVDVAVDGTGQDPITIIGYNATRGDNPDFANQPLIAAAANTYNFDNYWISKNIRCTTTAAHGWRQDTGGQWHNCKVQNSSGTANRYGFYCGGVGIFTKCEAISDSGYGVYGSNVTRLDGCYIHDCENGVHAATQGFSAINCIIDTCNTNGLQTAGVPFNTIVDNTIYNCGVGIQGTTSDRNLIFGNIIDSCTTGASWGTEEGTNFFDYNNWNNNGTDVTNVTKGDNALAVDPEFTDAPNGDFSIGTNLKGQGFPGAFPGALTTGYLDVGAVQREEIGGRRSRARRHGI